MPYRYRITDEMVADLRDRFDWIELAHEWGHTLRTPRNRDHWLTQFHAIAECLPWEQSEAIRILELCPGSGLITETLLEHYPNLLPSLMEVQPIFKQMAFENIRARSGRAPEIFSTDLREVKWWEAVGEHRYDVVATSDSLNGLGPETLKEVYRGCRLLLKPGGFFFNCDRVAAYSTDLQPVYDRVRSEVFGRKPEHWAAIQSWWNRIGEAFGIEGYSGIWLKELSDEDGPGLAGLPPETHVAYLQEAGFREAECVWFYFGDAILMGVAA